MNTLPLSARITAPAVATPGVVAGISWRPAALSDIDGLLELYRATHAVDHPTYGITHEELTKELGHSYLDLDRDTIIAIDDATGAMVALGAQLFLPGQETLVRSIIEGAGVHPDYRRRGIGRALLAWHEQRGLQQLASSNQTLPGWIQASADDRASSSARLFERSGYPPVRWFIGLTRALDERMPVGDVPDGIRIEPLSLENSAAAHAAKDAAYRDHWASQPTTDEQWDKMLGLDIVSFEHSFVAFDPLGEAVGVLVTWVIEEEWQAQGYSSGYVGIVGVVQEWRRRGVATALFAANFRSLANAGIERSDVDADSDNPNGGLGMYAAMGFVEHSRSANFVKEF